MNLFIQIRKLEKSDLDACIDLFRNTVHAINIQDYNQSQLDAWAPEQIDKNAWWESLANNIAYVAEYHGQIVGFGDMSYEGYFDRLYVHQDYQRKGIASALIKQIEEQARLAGIKEVHTEVSITAKPLMEAFGYQLIKKQVKEHKGQKFINFIMKKTLLKNYTINFKKLNEDDLKLLHQWFHMPHVSKWYARGKEYTFAEIQAKYLPRIGDATIPSYIIYDQDKPVGYIQFYHVKNHFPEGIKNSSHLIFNQFKPDQLAGIDFFIADEKYLHTGFSSTALTTCIDTTIKTKVKAAMVDPDKNNITAIKFFEKNGFEHIASQDDQHDLMIKHLVGENMNYTIYYDPSPKHDDTKIIWEGISEHAKKVRGLPPGKPFAFFIRDELNKIKGGCSGYIYYGCLYVDLLWVDESLRGKQYGTQLMQAAEKLAHDNHCHFIAVNTMDFEALEFYKKLDFTVEFERKGFDKNSSMYFLRKDLDEK